MPQVDTQPQQPKADEPTTVVPEAALEAQPLLNRVQTTAFMPGNVTHWVSFIAAVTPLIDVPVGNSAGGNSAQTQTTSTPTGAASVEVKASSKKSHAQAAPINAWTKPSDLLAFRPFEKSPRGEQWAVSDDGKQWISQRMTSFSNMEPPGGLPVDEVTKRVMTHRQWWMSELTKMYMANWPDFNVQEVLGTAYTTKQKALHDERIISFIEYALRRQQPASSSKDAASDVLSLLVNRVRKPVAYNVWAQHDETVDTKAKELAVKEPRWEDSANHLSVQMEKRKLLFERLPADEQEHWNKMAAETKAPTLSQEDCIAAIPKVYGMMGDSVRNHIDFHCLVLCGGKSPKGDACEEWRRPTMEDPLGFTSTKNWQTIQGAFLQGLSKDTGVPSSHIVQLPSWERPTEFIPKAVERLSDVLKIDDDGEVLTSLEGARQAADKYLEALWRLVPDRNGAPKKSTIPWTEVRRSRDDPERFVDPARLPSETFIFDRPKDLPKNELWKFVYHIIQGEKGLLPPERVFRWARQVDGEFEVAAKPRKQSRPGRHKSQKKLQNRIKKEIKKDVMEGSGDEETFDLDAVATSVAESESEPQAEAPKKSASRGRKAQNKKVEKDASKHKGKSRLRAARDVVAENPASDTKAGKKPLVRPSARQSRAATHASDADSDVDVDEQQVLFKGDATHRFIGESGRVHDLVVWAI
ncbi:hypothetical protein M422DRAFT_53614 [Sphaerobolus stellatus SS14]|uniref:Uncharacterized protein n=1 Tax=Sphaerobolus stellatus (strain SS14) TaxID=990650 RepID=A0A0C9TLP4_SPHS4|nr:hypothetical protein M422DRAFT_53614 [Sphaerobolus stellatus SS14]